jgi:hypothetical protein
MPAGPNPEGRRTQSPCWYAPRQELPCHSTATQQIRARHQLAAKELQARQRRHVKLHLGLQVARKAKVGNLEPRRGVWPLQQQVLRLQVTLQQGGISREGCMVGIGNAGFDRVFETAAHSPACGCCGLARSLMNSGGVVTIRRHLIAAT